MSLSKRANRILEADLRKSSFKDKIASERFPCPHFQISKVYNPGLPANLSFFILRFKPKSIIFYAFWLEPAACTHGPSSKTIGNAKNKHQFSVIY
jgi:hypothetical protein